MPPVDLAEAPEQLGLAEGQAERGPQPERVRRRILGVKLRGPFEVPVGGDEPLVEQRPCLLLDRLRQTGPAGLPGPVPAVRRPEQQGDGRPRPRRAPLVQPVRPAGYAGQGFNVEKPGVGLARGVEEIVQPLPVAVLDFGAEGVRLGIAEQVIQRRLRRGRSGLAGRRRAAS
jgi:hypothetical protein